MNRDLLTVDQVAAYLQVSPSTVKTYIWRRLLPACKIVGNVRILKADLDAWIESQRLPSVSNKPRLTARDRSPVIMSSNRGETASGSTRGSRVDPTVNEEKTA